VITVAAGKHVSTNPRCRSDVVARRRSYRQYNNKLGRPTDAAVPSALAALTKGGLDATTDR